ncbi:UNVERIFIED_CONTAM: hypothetical protein GTU68_063392 [Idotea baltica]|nr:hypothetical protein [Idotea baltica]
MGEPNVGKSTLLNALVGEKLSIITNKPQTTRHRIIAIVNEDDYQIVFSDTPGVIYEPGYKMQEAMNSFAYSALTDADVLLFMVDITRPPVIWTKPVASMLRKTKKKIIVAVNKVDNNARYLAANEFWGLGFENTFFLSSISGSGTGDFLDAVVDLLPPDHNPLDDLDIPKIAILGRPNVGKSSFVNALLDEDRNIVTDIAGTTRDAIHTRYTKFGKDLIFIDTAGIRKKRKVHEDLEFYSVIRAIKSIDETDVCLLMIDAQDGIEAQDMSIFSLIQRRRRGVIILINKWDLIEDKETNSVRDYEKEIKSKIAPFTDVPVLFISTLEKQRIYKAVDLIEEVYANKTRRIKTSVLNEALQEMLIKTPPPAHRGRMIKIKYLTQLPTKYPAFAFFCNHPQHVKEHYRLYLENQLRERFDFTGVPISVIFKEK